MTTDIIIYQRSFIHTELAMVTLTIIHLP